VQDLVITPADAPPPVVDERDIPMFFTFLAMTDLDVDNSYDTYRKMCGIDYLQSRYGGPECKLVKKMKTQPLLESFGFKTIEEAREKGISIIV